MTTDPSMILLSWSYAHDNVAKDAYTTPYGHVMRSTIYLSYCGMNAVLPPEETLVCP